MIKLDCNAFTGPWPFHKVRNRDFAALEAMHRQNGVGGGFVSSTEAIFYNDPLEADQDLARELAGRKDYRQVVTVNPTLPGTCAQLRHAIRELDVAGVRILPGLHGYPLHDPGLEKLCAVLEEERLPLFLTLRMEDARVEYLLKSQAISGWDLTGFLERHTNFPILLCNIHTFELQGLNSVLFQQDNVFADISGFKESSFCIEDMLEGGYGSRLVYGSTAPIFCLRSTLLLLETAQIPEADKAAVFGAQTFLDALEPRCRPQVKELALV